MFRHAQVPDSENTKKNDQKTDVTPAPIVSAIEKSKPVATLSGDLGLKELVEKNLKWSQIIYEQNRKINSKLMWMAIASWIKLFVIIIPLILAISFLPPVFKDIWSQYGELLGSGASDPNQKTNSFDSVIKLLNLDPAKQEQL